jgi:hypothetical protein
MFLATAATVYIATFKKDFNEEDMGKALLAVIIVGVLIFTASIISSI